MSTFPGLLDEIAQISVDRFDGLNLLSEAFFLSHFHEDHMVGLRSPVFHNLLKKKASAFLYCTEITKLFLTQNHLQGLDEKIRVLPINKEYVISVVGLEGCVGVTALPAGHCPGSIMFLFTHKGMNYLYTGDFRMGREDIMKMIPLKDADGNVKQIETLYLDTTFFHPCYSYLPSRDESMSVLIEKCKLWIEKGKSYIIDLRTPATIGVEYVLIKLSKEFAQPFHVSERAYMKYSKIPILSSSVTLEGYSQLHTCLAGSNSNSSHFCKSHKGCKANFVLTLKLCALRFKNLSVGDELWNESQDECLHRLVYSSHASHSELVEIVEVLHPKRIVPCVVPNDLTPEQVAQYLTPKAASNTQSSDSDDLSLLQFSSYEGVECSESESDELEQPEEGTKTEALLTLSKYNVKESSDEEQFNEESDEEDLPPFRWDCSYDGKGGLGFPQKTRSPVKRQKLDNC